MNYFNWVSSTDHFSIPAVIVLSHQLFWYLVSLHDSLVYHFVLQCPSVASIARFILVSKWIPLNCLLRLPTFLLLLLYQKHLLLLLLFLVSLPVSTWFPHVVFLLPSHRILLCHQMLVSSYVLLPLILSSAAILIRLFWCFLFGLPLCYLINLLLTELPFRTLMIPFLRGICPFLCSCAHCGRLASWLHRSLVSYRASTAFCSGFRYCAFPFFASVPFFPSRCAYHPASLL